MHRSGIQSGDVAQDGADTIDAREQEKVLRESAAERKKSAELAKHIETRDALITDLTAQLETRRARECDLIENLTQRESEFAVLGVRLQAQQRLGKELAGQFVKLDAALQKVFASTSWQITRPMRTLGHAAPWLARVGRRSLALGWWIVTGQFWRVRRAAWPNADTPDASLQEGAVPAHHRIGQIVGSSGVPAVLDISPVSIGLRPAHAADDHFWQYPCLTERDAFERHLQVAENTNIDSEQRLVHTYLGLPWATYLDRRFEFRDIAEVVCSRLSEARARALSQGFGLAVHTVCQHYAWWRMAGVFSKLGITDLHLSHCTEKAAAYFHGSNVRVHSWPLYAVNVEDRARRAGLETLKPTSEKRYLASFIGSHMAHYLSDVRLRLVEAAQQDGGPDVFVELTDQWHFDPVVYGEQMKRRTLNRRLLERHAEATYRYNKILSESVFSLCPEGAGPNSLRLWESLAVGTIPVVVCDDWIPPTGGDRSPLFEDACIVLQTGEVDGLFRRLRRIKPTEIEVRRRACVDLYDAIKTKLTFQPKRAPEAVTQDR